MDAKQLKIYEAKLVALREDILAEKEQVADDVAPVELDQARFGRLARMDEIQRQSIALKIDRRRDIQLKRIQGAFIRIENETYGDCVKCGTPINIKRLDFDPSVFFCIKCAETTQKR